MDSQKRILVSAHGHPDFNKGGAEIAAYNLFQAYQASHAIEQAFFLAPRHDAPQADGRIGRRRQGEYLWGQSISDHFKMKSTNYFELGGSLKEFLHATRPDYVHAHHYAGFGLEYFQAIKNALPDTKTILTLHEYLAICRNNGQMVKTGSLALCHESGVYDCQRCFPMHTREDFWLRKHRFEHFFRFVDHFVAPSHFLKDRYVQWGLPSESITVIENGHIHTVNETTFHNSTSRKKTFGFFGQINPYKGLHIVLEALALLDDKALNGIQFEVHGANLEWQEESFRTHIGKLRKRLEKKNVLRWVGPYQSEELSRRMSHVDYVVVPSVWWENSPMVIQEAFLHGRPVLCSALGGMAEKVTHNVDGLHVEASNPQAWVQVFERLSKSPDLWQTLHDGIRLPRAIDACAQEHLSIFRDL